MKAYRRLLLRINRWVLRRKWEDELVARGLSREEAHRIVEGK